MKEKGMKMCTTHCPFFPQEPDEIEKVCKKSKDIIECEMLGLTGPVSKNEKGKWCKVL